VYLTVCECMAQVGLKWARIRILGQRRKIQYRDRQFLTPGLAYTVGSVAMPVPHLLLTSVNRRRLGWLG
jgi:hypothetical protein